MKKALLIMIFIYRAIFADMLDAHYAVPKPLAPFTERGDMGMIVGDRFYGILTDFAPLREALGEPDEIVSAPSCVFAGEDREFRYPGFTIFTNPLGEKDVWFELYITGGDTATLRGLRVGDDMGDAEELYGEPHYWEGEYTAAYSVSGKEGDIQSPCMLLELDGDDVILSIDLYYPTNAS